MQFYVLQFQPIHLPESFVGIGYLHVFQLQILHLSEELRAVDHAVFHHHIVAIPDGRPAFGRKIAVRNDRSVYMPPRVFAIELGRITLQILTTFDARLTIYDGYML